MTENSTAGLTMLDAERSVVVAGDETTRTCCGSRARAAGLRIELVPVGPRLEARLDGQRVGELTALMSQRYGPTVDSVLRRGERPGCVGRVVRGKRGVEVELRLPAVNAAGGPPTEQLPVVALARPRRRSRTPLWVGVGVVGLLVVVGGALGAARASAPSATPSRRSTPRHAADHPGRSGPRSAPPDAHGHHHTEAVRRLLQELRGGVGRGRGAHPKGEPGYRTGLDPDGDGVACPVD